MSASSCSDSGLMVQGRDVVPSDGLTVYWLARSDHSGHRKKTNRRDSENRDNCQSPVAQWPAIGDGDD